jgi:hypothetical protein
MLEDSSTARNGLARLRHRIVGLRQALDNNWEANWTLKLRLQFFPSARSKNRFDYYTGSGAQTITAVPESDGLKIEFGDLGASGTIEVYCKEVTGVTRNGVKPRAGTDYQYDPPSHKLTVSFQGARKIAIAGAGSLF